MRRVLVAGATGYLGGFILRELQQRGMWVRALARDTSKLRLPSSLHIESIEGHMTDPRSIEGCCKDIDIIISTVGITRQKDGLTYMDVDYQANLNLLREARKTGVQKFIYISVFNGRKLQHLKICAAKEKFVDELKSSGIDFCVIRPNGFFSDMAAYLEMAKKGRIYLFQHGGRSANPIHGADLASLCVDAIDSDRKEIDIGGPHVLSHREIAHLAFRALGKDAVITSIPDWLRKMVLWSLRKFTSSKLYGPLEFFLTVMAMDMIAPEFGTRTLQDFFMDTVEN